MSLSAEGLTALTSYHYQYKCNIIEILLKIVAKSPTPLMTDTEKDDVLKKRQFRIEEVKVSINNIPDNIIGNIRNFGLTLKVHIPLIQSYVIKSPP